MTPELKRTVRAGACCAALLVAGFFVLTRVSSQAENPIDVLLKLPAPPPPNPDAQFYGRTRPPAFYKTSNPPPDNAPIADLLEYWRERSSEYRDLGYSPEPSDRVASRLLDEIQKDPKKLTEFLNILPEDERTGNLIKELYEGNSGAGGYDKNEKALIKRWLTYHTPHFSNDLARVAQKAGETGEYVSNQAELLALTRVDHSKAEPIIDRLYLDSGQKVSQVLATWARYRHALDTGSTGDIERYRDELKAVVENRDATAGMRDLALDALLKEKEWGGRDDWYYTLMADPTLADLKVNGTSYTGLTTIMYYAPDERYIDRMIELVGSDDPNVRSAAVRNLILKIDSSRPELIKALLPWLDDPKWAADPSGSVRLSLVRALRNIKVPESVPGLIKALDERSKRPAYAVNAMANAANYASNIRASANANAAPTGEVDAFVLRYDAIAALGEQGDPRAVPPLRRILAEPDSSAQAIIPALIQCKGFTVGEQVDGLDMAIRWQADAQAKAEAAAAVADANVAANTGISTYDWDSEYSLYGTNSVFTRASGRAPTVLEIKKMVGAYLLQQSEVSDDLAAGVVDHIEMLDKREPRVARQFRNIVRRWQNSAINLLLLRDVKRGVADADSMVRLLAVRKKMIESQSSAVHDIRTGTPTAVGLAACLLEDRPDYTVILDGAPTETKIAMLACARLIRAELPVEKVAEATRSTDKRLARAAELYLESEDSQAARTVVLSRHLGEAKITGATTAFFVEDETPADPGMLWMLFQSIGESSAGYNGWIYDSAEDLRAIERKLQDEVKKDEKLLGVYAYEKNYIRIYKDKVVFSWDEDDSRYRERNLSKEEFDELRAYLTVNNVDEMLPYLQCGGDYCEPRELLMLGRNGGRRIFMNGAPPPFFAGLDKYFSDLKKTPAVIRYAVGRDVPGLEVLIADDALHVETVWKDGSDLRVAASDTVIRKKVADEIEQAIEAENPDTAIDEDYEGYARAQEKRTALADKREYEGFGWRQVVDGHVVGPAAQPAGVDYIPVVDSFPVKANQESWKARAAGIELRGAGDGLYKIQSGRMTKIASGEFFYPVITPNGRWAIVNRGGTEGGGGLVRVNLLNNRITPLELEEYINFGAAAYVPATGSILVELVNYYDEHYGGYEVDDEVSRDSGPGGMRMISAETGVIRPAVGELRPLAQQSFRPLQKTGKPNEFWAALPDHDKNLTEVGVFNAAALTFRQVMTIPKIKFNSMTMWVDEAGGKVFFVYRGHLLTVPLAK